MRIKHQWEERSRAARAPHTDEPTSCSLFSHAQSAEPPLEAWHIREAFSQLQRDRVLLGNTRRAAGPPGGLRRTHVFVI